MKVVDLNPLLGDLNPFLKYGLQNLYRCSTDRLREELWEILRMLGIEQSSWLKATFTAPVTRIKSVELVPILPAGRVYSSFVEAGPKHSLFLEEVAQLACPEAAGLDQNTHPVFEMFGKLTPQALLWFNPVWQETFERNLAMIVPFQVELLRKFFSVHYPGFSFPNLSKVLFRINMVYREAVLTPLNTTVEAVLTPPIKTMFLNGLKELRQFWREVVTEYIHVEKICLSLEEELRHERPVAFDRSQTGQIVADPLVIAGRSNEFRTPRFGSLNAAIKYVSKSRLPYDWYSQGQYTFQIVANSALLTLWYLDCVKRGSWN